jgi:hypothetical protein
VFFLGGDNLPHTDTLALDSRRAAPAGDGRGVVHVEEDARGEVRRAGGDERVRECVRCDGVLVRVVARLEGGVRPLGAGRAREGDGGHGQLGTGLGGADGVRDLANRIASGTDTILNAYIGS